MILEHGEDAECRVAEPWADSTLPGCGRLERIRLGTPSCWLFNRPPPVWAAPVSQTSLRSVQITISSPGGGSVPQLGTCRLVSAGFHL